MIKQKDLIIVGAFLLVGGAIYLFFFTNVITGMFGIGSSNQGPVVEQTKSGFENFNPKVDKKEVVEYQSKEEAYEAQVQAEKEKEEQEQELAREKATKGDRQFKTPVNDLSQLMSDRSDKKKETIIAKEAPPVKERQDGTTVKKVPVRQNAVVKQDNEQAPVKTEKRRKRNSNPSFGEEVTEEVLVKNASAPGIISGNQSIKSGTRVLMRITEKLDIPDCGLFDANTLLTGTARVENSRVSIVITTSCDDGRNIKLQVVDPTDNTPGLYIETPSDNAQSTKDIAGDVVQQGSQQLGVPIVGRSLQKIGTKKLNTEAIPLESGKKIIIQVIK